MYERRFTICEVRSIKYDGEMHKLPDNFEALLEQRTQELKASEERFRNIIERNADGIVIMDRNGIVRFVNPAAEKLFNRKAKDFQGETLGFPVLAGETTEINIIRENKEPVLAEIRVVETEWEGRAVWLASLRDITERKEAEEALQAAEESFHAIVEKSPNGSIVVNREGIVQYVNPSGEILLNRKADELIDTMFGLPVTSDTITTELEILRKGGGTGIAECLVVDTEWRREDAYLITLHDITERKEAEETLIKANEQLKKLDQMKSEFVSVASHELRTPLTSIKNSVDLVLSGKTGEITEAQERFLSMAERNIGRLSILINDLLDISRIEAGKIDLNTTAIDLNNSFKQVVRSLNTLANTKDISLKINSPHNLPEIYGDTIRIEQVLTNFVGNAIKFTPERGTVTINARQVKEAPDKSEGRGGFIEVSVTDTGVGIPEEHIEHIFEKFYQVDSSLARHQQSDSTGLGLAICKGIVEAHGGRVWCKSREGEGSTFFFTLP
ncbi:MAG: ATP-binding protein, partial [Thermodesulfobacteriota bacterium]